MRAQVARGGPGEDLRHAFPPAGGVVIGDAAPVQADDRDVLHQHVVRPEHGQLAAGEPDEQHPRPGGHGAEGGVELRAADGVEDDLHAAAGEKRVAQILFVGVHRLGRAGGARGGEVVRAAGGRNHGRPHQAADVHRGEADAAPRPGDEQALAGPKPRAGKAKVRGAVGDGQSGRDRVRQAVRDRNAAVRREVADLGQGPRAAADGEARARFDVESDPLEAEREGWRGRFLVGPGDHQQIGEIERTRRHPQATRSGRGCGARKFYNLRAISEAFDPDCAHRSKLPFPLAGRRMPPAAFAFRSRLCDILDGLVPLRPHHRPTFAVVSSPGRDFVGSWPNG